MYRRSECVQKDMNHGRPYSAAAPLEAGGRQKYVRQRAATYILVINENIGFSLYGRRNQEFIAGCC
jgi:hypothetical protein